MPASRKPARSGAPTAPSGTRTSTGGRPQLSPRDLQALREAVARRQAATTPAPRAARSAPAAPGARTATPQAPTGTRPAGTRPVVRRAPAGRTGTPAVRTTTVRTGTPATRKPVVRQTTGRKTTARPAARPTRRTKERTGAPWSARLGVVALSTLLLPAVAALVLPGPQQPGGGEDPLDVATLALTARSSLLEDADRYRQLEQEVAQRQAELQQARETETAARERTATERTLVGAAAASLYRAVPADRLPVFSLDVSESAAADDVLYQQALADRAERARETVVVRAQRAGADLAAAGRAVAAAEAAVEEATRAAAAVLAEVRETVDDLSTDVTSRIAALGTVEAAADQQARNQGALQRWQTYLGQLSAAGIELPAAAELTDLTDLPPGLSPALDDAGQPIPGVAWAVVGSSPVTVLPSETVAAVSNALSQLGKPYVAGTSGPDTYDCGGFTAAAWLLAGYDLPAGPADQWATGAAVPTDALQIGDLVFSPAGRDVGIYLGEGDVVGASAAGYQVGVRSVPAGASAVRVSLPRPAEANAALAGTPTTAECGAPLPTPERTTPTPAWGGYANGQIPNDALCQLGVYRHALRCDAAAGYQEMATAFAGAFGTPLCITDSYRSLGAQVSAFYRKPKLAALPGTSNHGWALAVDLCGGINVAGTPEWNWMTANAGRFGWVQPSWAQPGAEKPEPWHWEFGVIS